jgi:hypothetical protein
MDYIKMTSKDIMDTMDHTPDVDIAATNALAAHFRATEAIALLRSFVVDIEAMVLSYDDDCLLFGPFDIVEDHQHGPFNCIRWPNLDVLIDAAHTLMDEHE